MPPPQARPPPLLPKVALLFLTRGNLPYEPVWRAFLESATAAVQLAAPPGVSPADWRQLFSLYSHLPPGHTHPAGSLFEGHEVPDRAGVQWGDHSMVSGRQPLRASWVHPPAACRLGPLAALASHSPLPRWLLLQMDAERALLRVALGDPLNQRFVLISDSCVPLWPAPAVWVELMGESRSRTHFCKCEERGWGAALAAVLCTHRTALLPWWALPVTCAAASATAAARPCACAQGEPKRP